MASWYGCTYWSIHTILLTVIHCHLVVGGNSAEFKHSNEMRTIRFRGKNFILHRICEQTSSLFISITLYLTYTTSFCQRIKFVDSSVPFVKPLIRIRQRDWKDLIFGTRVYINKFAFIFPSVNDQKVYGLVEKSTCYSEHSF